MGVDELSESMIALGLGRGTSKEDGKDLFIRTKQILSKRKKNVFFLL